MSIELTPKTFDRILSERMRDAYERARSAPPVRLLADNVLIRFEPAPKQSAGGIHIPDVDRKKHHSRARETRVAVVLAVGPGHYRTRSVGCGGVAETRVLVPTQIQVGERVLVDSECGQDYSLDATAPRHNKSAEFRDLVGDGEFRIVREEEILGVVEDG